MTPMPRASIRQMMEEIMVRQGRRMAGDEAARLQDVGFRSLDFSELALRVEAACGRPLQFEAGALRAIQTVRDVLDFMERAVGNPTP
jgi:acyl carrier protein